VEQMNHHYEFETRMNQIKAEIEKKAREAWKTSPQAPRRNLNFQFIKNFVIWLQKL
jgi:hypothetical protein